MMADKSKQRHGGCMVAAMAFLAVGSAFGALKPSAQTFYWTGAQDSYWTNANNLEFEGTDPAKYLCSKARSFASMGGALWQFEL